MSDANIIQKTPTDKACVLNVRAWEVQRFVAPGWTDLRVGFFLSLTSESADDDPAGVVAETIGSAPRDFLPWTDRYLIGLVDKKDWSVFVGFTNIGSGRVGQSMGRQMLVSSDAGVGTTNTNFWRPKNEESNNLAVQILDGGRTHIGALPNLEQHFPQIPANTGGYAMMLGMQLLRDNPQSRTIRVNIKSSANSADMLYSDTPTLDVLKAAMATWPPSQQIGPVTFSVVPTAFYFYWPFRQSRLRIHSYGILKPS